MKNEYLICWCFRSVLSRCCFILGMACETSYPTSLADIFFSDFFLSHFFIVSKLRELWHFHCFKLTGLQFLNVFIATILNHGFEKICYKGKEKYKQELWNLFSENKYWLNCRSTKCIKYSWKFNISDFRLSKQYRLGQSIECIF